MPDELFPKDKSPTEAPRVAIEDIPSQKGSFVGAYLVKSKTLAESKTGSLYLRLKLGDASGDIDAFVWDNAKEVAETIHKGQVVLVKGKGKIHQQRPNLMVHRIRPALSDEYNLDDIVSGSEQTANEAFDFVKETVEEVHDSDYKALLDELFADEATVARFKLAPGAKAVHHAFVGGLIVHTASMLHICKCVVGLYEDLNADLLITSCILHDLGKLKEYSEDLVIERTTRGRLWGHIVISILMVEGYINKLDNFPESKKEELYHILISHHGSLEWGSPAVPMTLEAVALHYIDNLDAKVNQFRSVMKSRKDPDYEGWTTFDRLLSRYLYLGKPKAASENREED